MLRFCIALVGFIVSISSLFSAPVPKETTPQFVIVSKKEKVSQLFLVDGDGKNLKALTDEKSNASYPQWSPDGKQIAFASDRVGGILQIFTMDADGTNVKQITEWNQQCRVPAWSPDGKTLLFCRYGKFGSGSEICSVPSTGGEAKVLDIGGDGWDPAWSPDGKQISFVSVRGGGGYRLYIADADGKNVKKLTDEANPMGLAYPEWAPDGKSIVFGHLKDNVMHLFRIDTDGKNLRQLTIDKGRQVYPTWSGNGKKIAYYHSTGNLIGSITIMDEDGKNPKVVLKDVPEIEGGRPSWRPR